MANAKESAADKFFQAQPGASVQRLSITASVLRDISNLGTRARDQWDPSNLQGLRTVHTIFSEYEYRVQRDQNDALQYGAAGWLLQGAVVVGGAFLPAGTVPSIMKGLGSAGANAGISSAVDELKNHGRQQTSAWLENALSDLVQRGKITDLSNVKPFTAEQRRDWLRKQGLVDSLLAKAPEVRSEDRPIVEGMLIKALDDRINRSLDIQRDRDREQDAEIAHQAQQIGGIARTLNEFRQETENELGDIRQQQTELNNRITVIADDVSKTRQDVQFLQKFLFEKMNPSEQLAALRGSMFAGMPEEERARLTAKIAIMEKRQALVSAIATFSDGAATVARIATRLHVNQNVVSAVQKGSEIAKAAQVAVTGFMTGGMGYLAAADAVTGLVFGNGPDPGAQRQAEIMSALNEIKQGIVEIEGMLVQMSKQLDQIMQAQKATYDAIVAVSKQIQDDHREVMAELARIRSDLVPIAAVVDEILFKDIEACATFQKRLEDAKFERTHSIPYPLLRSIHRDYGRQSLKGLRDILRDPFTSMTYDLRRFKGDPGSQVDALIEHVYQPTIQHFDRWIFTSRAPLFAKSFGMPVNDIRALDLKRDQLFGNTPPKYETWLSAQSDSDVRSLLGITLSPQVIARHGRFLMYAHPFFEIDEALEESSPDKIISMETTSIEGRELLRSTLRLVETAVAQQTMLSGDAALVDLDNAWRDAARPRQKDESDAAYGQRLRRWSEFKDTLVNNHALRRNLILYAVSRAVKETGNPVLYGAGYGLANNESYLRTMLPSDRFVLVWRPPAAGQQPVPDYLHPENSTGWHLRVFDQEYPLPTPVELSTGELVHTPDLKALLDLKNQILEELHGYLMAETLSLAERQAFRQTIWAVVHHQQAAGN
jgi:hypothetical protein